MNPVAAAIYIGLVVAVWLGAAVAWLLMRAHERGFAAGRRVGRMEERNARANTERVRAWRDERKQREASAPLDPTHDPYKTTVIPALVTGDMPPLPPWNEPTQFLHQVLREDGDR